MKQLVCEMCGSKDLIKQEGVFVCQACGCKYSLEEARKMMIEGTVDVTGSTVKIDTSKELESLYQIARRARNDNNSEHAAKYYDMILVKDPTSWEAAFYSVYYSAIQTNIANIQSEAVKVNNSIDTVLYLIRDYVSNSFEQEKAVAQIAFDSAKIASMFCDAAIKHYKETAASIRNNYTEECVGRISSAKDILYNLGNQIDKIFLNRESFAELLVSTWKSGITLHQKCLPYLAYGSIKRKDYVNQILGYCDKITKYSLNDAEQLKKEILKNEIVNLNQKMRELKGKDDENFSTNAMVVILMVLGLIGCLLSDGFILFFIPCILLIAFAVLYFVLLGVERTNSSSDVNLRKKEIMNLLGDIDGYKQELMHMGVDIDND